MIVEVAYRKNNWKQSLLNFRENQHARLSLWPRRDDLIIQLHRAMHVRCHRGSESRINLSKKHLHLHQRKTVKG